MKSKVMLFSIFILATILLVACKPEENTAPTFSGVANTATPYGVEFNPLLGVTAFDKEDGDLTDEIVVTGEIDVFEAGEYELNYKVEDSEGLFAEAKRVITVNPSLEASLANGWYNYKFASSESRHDFFSAAEKWLLENGYAGIPLAAQSGLTMQHDRIVLPVAEYIPSFGWGTSYSTLTKDDATVAAENEGQLDLLQTVAVEGEYTYRTWMQQEPDTLNYYVGESSTESDYGSYINGSFYEMALNDTATGWQFVPSLASGEPIPVGGEVVNGKMTSKVWEIPLRDNLKWVYNTGTDTTGFPAGHDDLDAHDYEYTYRLALDQEWFRATQGGGDFVSQKIKGAEAYATAVASGATQSELDALWEDFGIHASEDGLKLIVEYTEPVSTFNFKYNFGAPAVNQALYESAPELYGTDPQHVASSGMYFISYWEDGVGSRYTKNVLHPRSSEVSWTAESIKIIEGTSAQDQAFEAFENGLLDAVGIPNSRVQEFKDDPRVLRTPGASVWSLNINMVGTTQAQQAQWPGSTYIPEPILANKDFRLALYFILDRDKMVQYDVKTYPTSMKISAAYYVDPEEGIPYRSTPQGMSVGENLAYSTNGYDPEAAQTLFKRAVAAEIAAGNYVAGTADNYTIIDIEVLTFDANSGAAIADNWIAFAKDYFELLVDDTNYVKVAVTPKKLPGSQIYDEIEAGNYELALSSIQGSTLDAASFLDIFITDNRSGFLLNYGYDSSVPEIEVRWEENGEEHFELFSFDAIYELLNGKVYLKDGNKISEYNSIDNIIEVFLGSTDLTEVSRSEEDGDAIFPIIFDEFESEADDVIPYVLVAKDKENVEYKYLVIIEKTGNVYELHSTKLVTFETSEEAILDSIEGIADAEQTVVSEAHLEELTLWFEWNLDVYESVNAYYYDTATSRTLVVVGKQGNLYLLIGTEDLIMASEENIVTQATAAVTQYGYSALNITKVETDEELIRTGYIEKSFGATTFEELAESIEISANWVSVYEFDLDAEGTQRTAGDIYILVVIVAGHIVYSSWL